MRYVTTKLLVVEFLRGGTLPFRSFTSPDPQPPVIDVDGGSPSSFVFGEMDVRRQLPNLTVKLTHYAIDVAQICVF